MKKGFVATENFRRLQEATNAVERRGAPEAGLVLIKGPYGVGKSKTIERWAADNNLMFVRCMKTWSQRSLLDAVAEKMELDTRGRNSEVQARIITKLATKMVPLLFDEADHLIPDWRSRRSSPTLLEVIRDITDVTGAACYLLGMENLVSSVGRYKHICSRVNRVVEFQELSVADVKAALDKLCDVQVDADLAPVLHRAAKGRMRLVLNAISNIEDWAATNSWDRVGAQQVKGRQLCVDFDGGMPGVSTR